MGGIIWGLGIGLMEQSEFDGRTGRPLNASLADYHVPVNADIGNIDITVVEEDNSGAPHIGHGFPLMVPVPLQLSHTALPVPGVSGTGLVALVWWNNACHNAPPKLTILRAQVSVTPVPSGHR